jgi:hypothetical protein
MELLASLPWPRGICIASGKLFALGRGRPRSVGGPDPNIDDRAGVIFEISISGGEAVAVHEPISPPFHLWDKQLPIYSDIETDRPYVGLAWHEASQNFFICCFSGIDKPTDSNSFRKNSTDAVLRFDCRVGKWFEVERHDPSVVPVSLRQLPSTSSIPNNFYPSNNESIPHGWLNGPDALLVHGNDLFVAGKDNHSLIRYDLSPLISEPNTAYLQSYVMRRDTKDVLIDGSLLPQFDGPSALETDGISLFVGLRSKDIVLSFPLTGPFDIAFQIATLPPKVELIDLALSPTGELFVASKVGKIWNIGLPDSAKNYQATDENVYASLPTDGSNITFGQNGKLYACCDINGGAIFNQTNG